MKIKSKNCQHPRTLEISIVRVYWHCYDLTKYDKLCHSLEFELETQHYRGEYNDCLSLITFNQAENFGQHAKWSKKVEEKQTTHTNPTRLIYWPKNSKYQKYKKNYETTNWTKHFQGKRTRTHIIQKFQFFTHIIWAHTKCVLQKIFKSPARCFF